ncbi:MAG: rhomboid family intramembrane serine protease [Planctomycetota bacterium]
MPIPYAVDVERVHTPWVNWIVMGLCVVMLVVSTRGEMVLSELNNPLIFDAADFTWSGLFGHMWLHANPIHLAGNMLFLYVFGNAVCSKLGNLRYALFYVGLGLVSGLSFMLFNLDEPWARVVGASGAINGVVGMFLVLYPTTEMSIVYWFGYFFAGRTKVYSIWMILLWLVYDLVGLGLGLGGVAYSAHVGGFVGGVALASVLLLTRAVIRHRREETLLEWFGIKLPVEGTHSALEGRIAMKQQARYTHPSQANPRHPEPVQRLRLPDADPEPAIRRQTDAEADAQARLRRAQQQMSSGPTEAHPPEPDHLIHDCDCGARLKAPRRLFGKTIRCPRCKQPVVIPEG